MAVKWWQHTVQVSYSWATLDASSAWRFCPLRLPLRVSLNQKEVPRRSLAQQRNIHDFSESGLEAYKCYVKSIKWNENDVHTHVRGRARLIIPVVRVRRALTIISIERSKLVGLFLNYFGLSAFWRLFSSFSSYSHVFNEIGQCNNALRAKNQNIKMDFQKERTIRKSCVEIVRARRTMRTSIKFPSDFSFSIWKNWSANHHRTAFDQAAMKETTFCYFTPECKYHSILRQIAKLSLFVWCWRCVLRRRRCHRRNTTA